MAEPSEPNVTRHTSWAGLRPGDSVEIDDRRARRASFSFVAYVEHRTSGSSWVEVVGGRRGDRKLWSFRPEQVYAPGAGGKGPSLDDAPRLPL
jgi:hypothetical protein